MQIYVVDDDSDLRKSVSISLKAAGFSVQSFATADAFISVANDLTPGCVLLDYCMPGLDGLEAQRLLQFSDSLHRIILCTGVGEIPEAVRAMRAGAVDVLAKPYRRGELLDAIARAGAELENLISSRSVPTAS